MLMRALDGNFAEQKSSVVSELEGEVYISDFGV